MKVAPRATSVDAARHGRPAGSSAVRRPVEAIAREACASEEP